MKIVHVEDFVHPDAGYQLNLLAPLQRREGHEVTIVTAELEKFPAFVTGFFGTDNIAEKDAAFERETGVKIVRVPLIGYYSGRAIFRPSLFKRVSELKPDVVFVHGEDTLTGMLFILLSRWLSYPLVFDCHMVEMASLNRFREYFRAFYRRFITPIILRRNIPLIRVVDSDFVEKCLGIPLKHTDLLSFGTDTSYFCPDAAAGRAVRARHGLGEDAFLVLYAGKLDETKGGQFLAETLRKRFPAHQGRPIEFIIIGTAAGEYGAQVDQSFLQSENRIVRLQTMRYRDLAEYYQAADLAIFPKQCSMSFFEVQSCGVPILFEENEINCQRAVSRNATLFEPGNIESFRSRIMEMAAIPQAEYDQYRRDAREYVLKNYDYVPIARRFTEVLERAIAAWNKRPRSASPTPATSGQSI